MNNLSIVEALGQIAREKNVDRQLVVQTLADALVSAAKKRYGNTENYEAEIDPTTGSMDVYARRFVVENVDDPELEISLEEAREIDANAQLGAVIRERLNFADFGRNAIQTAKQILIQRVREAERERVYDEFSGRVGHIESGVVQQISHGDIILTLGRAEAAVPFREQIRRERYRQGDSIRGYIFEVLRSSRGPQVLLSRAHPELLKKLFAIEVPEIAEGIVQIHAVAREPGERAKIAVSSNDDRVDPVGACVGVKGSRVQAIVRELNGERIDIVPWSEETGVFVGRALSPATVSRVIPDHRRKRAVVLVTEDQLSLAIGKSGQNSRLAAQLTGWSLDIITEPEYQTRRARLEGTQQVFRRIAGVTEMLALSLATSGFTSVLEIAEAPLDMLTTVPGLDEDGLSERIKASAASLVAEHADEPGVSRSLELSEPAAEPAAEPETAPEPVGAVPEEEAAAAESETTPPALDDVEPMEDAMPQDTAQTASGDAESGVPETSSEGDESPDSTQEEGGES